MQHIPFLRPSLVPKEAYLPYLDEIDRTHIYSNFGPLNLRFEERLLQERFHGSGAISTVANATLGLMLAIAAVKRPEASFAVMPSFTFAATPLAAMWCGLTPYFVDIDADDLCMSETQLKDVIQRLGSQIAVLLPYAAFGGLLDLQLYRSLLDSGLPVVVDAAASLGTADPMGQFGVDFTGIVVFSLHATKAFCVGEGGLIYSADTALIGRIRKMMNFGFSNARTSEDFGLNAKLSEYAAAIGLATLDRYDSKIARRQVLHDTYRNAFREHGLSAAGWEFPHLKGRIPHQFVSVLCHAGATNTDIVKTLAQHGIESRTYFSPPCHQQPQFQSFPRDQLVVTNNVTRRIVSLPLWEDMTPGLVDRVVVALAEPRKTA
jgi:dTDP-4-amino-4,6-dideoxygalactose transaminase